MEFQGVEFSGQAPCMLLCSAGVEESPFCLSACSHSQLRAVLQVGQVLSLLAESIDPLQGLSFFRFSGPLNQWAYYIPDQEYLVLGLNVGPKCMREAGGFVERRAEWSTRGMGSDQWEVDRCPCLPARRPRELPLCLHRRPDEMNHAARGAVRALNLACRIGIADAEASLSLNRPWRVDAFLLPMCVCGSALSERGNRRRQHAHREVCVHLPEFLRTTVTLHRTRPRTHGPIDDHHSQQLSHHHEKPAKANLTKKLESSSF